VLKTNGKVNSVRKHNYNCNCIVVVFSD